MIELTNFKILQRGFGGLEVKFKAYYDIPNGRKIVEEGSKKRTVPVGKTMLAKINSLKYYFLILTGHWIRKYADYFDRETLSVKPLSEGESYNGPWAELVNLWKKVTITSASKTDNGGFTISGFIEVIDQKPVNISTPEILISDDYGLFEETLDVLNNISDDILEYFSTGNLLENPKEKLKEIAQYTDEDFADLSEEDIMDQLTSLLEAKGAVILSPAESERIDKKKKAIAPGLSEDKEPETPEEETSNDDPVEESGDDPVDEAEDGITPHIDIPKGEQSPDPEIGEIVSKTIDDNVDDGNLPIDEQGMAEGMYSQPGEEGEKW